MYETMKMAVYFYLNDTTKNITQLVPESYVI